MTIRLGLDASLRIPSCAIATDSGVLLASSVGYHPVEGFPSVIRETLRTAGLQLSDVDEFVACVGPGSYMGVRSAVTTANALGLAVGRHVTGILSVDAVAVGTPARGPSTVAVPAGRGRFYTASYRWSGETLYRDSLPKLVDEAGLDAFRACEPNSSSTDEIRISAEGALIVAEQQRHLATETCRPEVAPHLPPGKVLGSQ